MAPAAEICESHASADYRRKARRLRRVYADRPGQLYRRLTELAQVPPVPPPADPDDSLFRVAWAGTPARAACARPYTARAGVPAHATPDVRAFAQLAALEFEGSILRYSRRLALLKMAEQMNIGRFEANLIIALIQHRLNETGAGAGSATQQAPQVSFSLVGLLPLITFLFVQSAIVWGIWHAIH